MRCYSLYGDRCPDFWNITVLAMSKRNTNAVEIIIFLHRLCSVCLFDCHRFSTRTFCFLIIGLFLIRYSLNTSKSSRKSLFVTTLWSFMNCWMRWWTLGIPKPRRARSCRSEQFRVVHVIERRVVYWYNPPSASFSDTSLKNPISSRWFDHL